MKHVINDNFRCYSHIGRQGGRQEVSIGRGCESKATTIHEIMHAIGFYHEQSRRDRDQYVTVNYHNIVKGLLNSPLVYYMFDSIHQWSSTSVPPLQCKGSARSYKNAMIDCNF